MARNSCFCPEVNSGYSGQVYQSILRYSSLPTRLHAAQTRDKNRKDAHTGRDKPFLLDKDIVTKYNSIIVELIIKVYANRN